MKYLTNENNQVIRMYDFKIDINNIGDIISAEIYLKNKKLYLFNYTFFNDINIGETEVTVIDIKSKIIDHLSNYG